VSFEELKGEGRRKMISKECGEVGEVGGGGKKW
jgi:hypothetical protein